MEENTWEIFHQRERFKIQTFTYPAIAFYQFKVIQVQNIIDINIEF